MTHVDDESGELPELSNRELLRVLMQEIADTNHELSEKIDGLDKSMRKEMVDMKKELKSDIHTLRLEVHQNHTSFIANHDALEKRVIVLELAGARA